MKYISILLILQLFVVFNIHGQKPITIEDIYVKGTFRTRGTPGFNFMQDGKHYTLKKGDAIKKYDITTGNETATILESQELGTDISMESYVFGPNESKILIFDQGESVYRHSSKEMVYSYELSSKKLCSIFPKGKVSNATYSPDGTKVAYVFENNLYYTDLNNCKSHQLTTDGKMNEIINGMCDWVYEEEFSFTKAFYWSPDSKNIAFIRFDEKDVPEFTMQLYKNEAYPIHETFKYPKVGEKNATVSVWISALKGKAKKVNLGNLYDMYVPRVYWTNDPSQLCVFTMNRHQNDLKLNLVDVKKNKSRVMYLEKNDAYIEINDDLTFLQDNKHFIWSSEKDGYQHLYLIDMINGNSRQLTMGNFDVINFYGYDAMRDVIYFQAAIQSPMNHYVYAMSLKDKNIKQVVPSSSGNQSAKFSSTYDYLVLTTSNINQAPSFRVYDNVGNFIRTIEENAHLSTIQEEYGVAPIEFFEFKTSENITLNGWMIKPQDFDPNKRYPLFMTQYSGPNSQQVLDRWKGADYWWYQMLAQSGYIIACVDGRGTGARGEAFRKVTYMQLGHYEVMDQIEAARYLGAQNYIDATRIGIYGWSYGGYMSSLCLLKGNEVFKTAIAVAPVTNWKWYDSIYTERYMRTYKENSKGYDDNSPTNFASQLKGNYLIIHGMADDNVHFQNAVEMVDALIQSNKQFETYYYPNRNHGIYGGNTRLHLFNKMSQFIFDKI